MTNHLTLFYLSYYGFQSPPLTYHTSYVGYLIPVVMVKGQY